MATEAGRTGWWADAVVPGLLLGAVVMTANLTSVISGTYTSGFWYWVVLLIEWVAALWIARRAAPVPAPSAWLRQVVVVVLAFSVAALPIALGTWVGWTVIEPDYADKVGELARQRYTDAGLDAAEVERRTAQVLTQYAPHLQTWYVFAGTLITGLLFGFVAATVRTFAAWLRSRSATPATR